MGRRKKKKIKNKDEEKKKEENEKRKAVEKEEEGSSCDESRVFFLLIVYQRGGLVRFGYLQPKISYTRHPTPPHTGNPKYNPYPRFLLEEMGRSVWAGVCPPLIRTLFLAKKPKLIGLDPLKYIKLQIFLIFFQCGTQNSQMQVQHRAISKTPSSLSRVGVAKGVFIGASEFIRSAFLYFQIASNEMLL